MIALFSTAVKPEDIPYIQELVSQIEAHQMDIKFYEPFFRKIEGQIITHNTELFNQATELHAHDYLFSLGGDGTLLSAAALLLQHRHRTEIPILGINFGRLGFLTSVGKNELENLLADIENHHYKIELHSLLQGKDQFALNEICLRSNKAGKMLDINVFVDDAFLTTYTADGLIVATPTGSTAYSLSCGGPIISPDSPCLCITPICPHNLTFRPLIIPDTSVVKLEVAHSRDDVSLHFDSKSSVVKIPFSIEVSKAAFEISLIRMNNHNFFTAIRNKLMWGTTLWASDKN
jgi:NAD+ kinase